MKVIVGSKNPVKLAAVKQAFEKHFPKIPIDFEGSETDSGVKPQPMTIGEAITGAVNRAKNAAVPEADFSVGIEGGVSFHKVDNREYGLEISWVCVLDCKTGRNEIASAPGFPVFPHVLKHLHAGKELTAAMEIEYGLTNLGQKNGYIGWLSDDVVTRESSNYEAVLLALSSLQKEAAA